MLTQRNPPQRRERVFNERERRREEERDEERESV